MSHVRLLVVLLIGPIAGAAAGDHLPSLKLPVEVAGADGATATVTVDIPEAQARRVRSLWMQIHNLSYADMVSIQVNAGAWVPLNNDTAAVEQPGKSYGGIGGGFATLKLTLPIPPGAVAAGTNTIRFRFNKSDGLVSGFRVLAFNFVAADGATLLPATAFSQDDPNAWLPPRDRADDIAAGKPCGTRPRSSPTIRPTPPPSMRTAPIATAETAGISNTSISRTSP